ncbi:PREDICTED: uncharacterized protein LOC104700526 isoform X2 [Camelina sativa]|uniref:Uncharacterized protein LOC104700526 isoform X2 n=1 Tax=Camelina sativa TaxID=90675 RepID=A0ABM0SPU0_CAMSA|nr:PREDICTED: uncharacterized protein LOC104700526 isoform X2 [Camelina sativa]
MYTFSASVSPIAAAFVSCSFSFCVSSFFSQAPAVTLTMESNKFVRSFSSSSSDSESLKFPVCLSAKISVILSLEESICVMKKRKKANEPLVETADFKRGVLTPDEVSVVDYKNGLKPVIWSITTTHLPRPQLMNLQAPSQSSAPQDRMDIFSLCMPELSASSSLPYLPRLWLRTLAFLVETQNPDTGSVMSKVILALWSHLRSVPYPAGGKEFGDHKRRFFKEPFTLECQAVNQKNHGVYIYYINQALKFIPQLNFPASVTNVLSSFLCSSEPIEIKADLGVKRKTPLMAGKSILKKLLTAATSAYSNLSDSESLHVQMIQMMRRCRFLPHVLVFILL